MSICRASSRQRLVELQVELIAIVHSHFGHRIYHTVTAGNAPLPLGNDTWHEVADISSGGSDVATDGEQHRTIDNRCNVYSNSSANNDEPLQRGR